MTEPEIRALFAREASGELGPTQVDHAARRRGRARLRRRRAGVAGTSALAAAAVAAFVVAAVPGSRPSPHPAAAGPSAPRQFSPLVTNLSFGFLPPGVSVQAGGVEPTAVVAVAAASSGGIGWTVDAFAQGRCHLTSHGSKLSCPGPTVPNSTSVPLTGRAPAVNGHPAFWAGPDLVWEYARGGWAILTAPVASDSMLQHNRHVRPLALRVARGLRVGPATPHLVFPAQFTHMDSGWRVGESHYFAEGGTLQAQQYTLLSGTSRFLPHIGDLGIWTNGAYVSGRKGQGTCTPNDPATHNRTETINGFRVVVKHGNVVGVTEHDLCAAGADGLAFGIQEFGPHPPIGVASLFRRHVQLLGPDPANWTGNPIG